MADDGARRQTALVGRLELSDAATAALGAGDRTLELALFGTDEVDAVIGLVERCCLERVGAPAVVRTYTRGVGLVAVLGLADGRDVVLKVHRWNATRDRLLAVHGVQVALADRGLPVPRPLAAPTSLGRGVVTFEAFLSGEAGPWSRATLAAGLRRLVAAAWDLDADVGAPLLLRPPGAPLWPEPHDLRFDFAATVAGAGWIDDLEALARDRLSAGWDRAPAVVGHFDWRVENLGFREGEIVAVYDWDSLARAPEAVIVGAAAGTYRIDWRLLEADPLPSVDDMAGFVADYELARGRPFDDDERDLLDAANLAHLAYGARCQHADLVASTGFGGSMDAGFLRLLGERGERFFVGT